MPLITKDKRDKIDSAVDGMWFDIEARYQQQGWDLSKAGNLAYIVYRIMLLASDSAGERGWGTMTRVWSDVALGAAGYFKRWEIDPYEDQKWMENGPVILQYDDEIPF